VIADCLLAHGRLSWVVIGGGGIIVVIITGGPCPGSTT